MKIGLIGYGRLGELLGRYIKQDFDLAIYDDQKEEFSTNLDEVLNSNIVIIAVPISEIKNCLSSISPKLKSGTLVIDCCSVKEYPLQLMEELLPKDIEILGAHPMFGHDSIKDTLYGSKLVLCPERISEAHLSQIKNYLENYGIRVIETTAEDHDQQIAKSLILSHFIGKGLLDFGAKDLLIDTKGYRRLLRILSTVENDSDQLFIDMNKYNRYASQMREELLSSLKKVSDFAGESSF